MELYKKQALVNFVQDKEISKSLKKSPMVFKEQSSLLFNYFNKLRPDSAICPAIVFMR